MVCFDGRNSNVNPWLSISWLGHVLYKPLRHLAVLRDGGDGWAVITLQGWKLWKLPAWKGFRVGRYQTSLT